MSDLELIKSQFKYYPDFPKNGMIFLDIFPIFRDPFAVEALITRFVHHITSYTLGLSDNKKIDTVVALDARGFLLGPIIALRLGAAFVPVRKKGKLPGDCVNASYEKEYGPDVVEMQAESIRPGDNVVVVDDVLATGGSAKSAGDLIAELGGKTLEYLFIVEISFLKGASNLDAPVYSAIQINE